MSLSRGLPIVVVLILQSAVARAEPPVPICGGGDARAAAAARAEGIKHYRLSRREGAKDPELLVALEHFDVACSAGDESVLELRAYALAALERFVEAARSLDAFLDAHALETLTPDVQERVRREQSAILARVSSLTVEVGAPGAVVTVDQRPVGKAPIMNERLEPGSHEIVVTPVLGAAIRRTVELGSGPHTERFEIAPLVEDSTPPATAERPAITDTPHAYRPWAWATGIAAVTLLGVGVGSAFWASGRSATYNSHNCANQPTGGCDSTLSQYHLARGMEVAGLVGGGLAAIASGILFYLDAEQAPRPKGPRAAQRSTSCRLGLLGASCHSFF